ncbi:MAG: FAD-linked oxidase C-terminal domain-containing protein [Pseudomonadota bacterium]
MNMHVPINHALRARLEKAIEGDVLFDRFSRGRYATDASIYQIEPVGVVIPRSTADVEAALAIAREEGVAVLPRGGGSSQCGQTVGRALVMDFTKYMNKLVSADIDEGTCIVEPGIVMDEVNRQLKSSGLWFPVDVSTSSRATIGGMAGNNSCGTRSLRYGIMRDNVLSIDALLADGTAATFGPVCGASDLAALPEAARGIADDVFALARANAATIEGAFPEVSRRVGGYLIDALLEQDGTPANLATLLCGSEGTLALSTKLTLKLSPQPVNKALGICHFPTFRSAMEAAQHIVKLSPVAVEVVDRTLIELARDIDMFRPVMEAFVRGAPDALLLTEFAEADQGENLRRLAQLEELMGDLGHPGAVVKVEDAAQQKAVWGVRAAGLNIMMSMKSEGKPVSFIEDCAVPLEHLADYTERLTEVFTRHGTKGTWYAHASVGCLHVRPVLNLKQEKDVRAMRAIAEEAFAMVREYKGSHSGEHGDGLVRSEFHEAMYGRETTALFEQIKDRFDPRGLMNPGKIVRPPRMDERRLLRYRPDYRKSVHAPHFDWRSYPSGAAGFQGAVEMCNNNGACRELSSGAMCPSYRVTRNERDLTRGRANTLRLALSGQLGGEALISDDMAETMKLCVACKACKRECPTGVDMAKMKTEVLAARVEAHGLALRERLVAYMPHYAPWAARLAPLANLRDRLPGAAALSERIAGFKAERPLPRWTTRPFKRRASVAAGTQGVAADPRDVVLFADTFNRYFEPSNLWDAVDVLEGLGYRVHTPSAVGRDARRPLCCGRTFLSAGLVRQARAEAKRTVAALSPFVEAGVPVIGLEPSCLLTLRDEFPAMLAGRATDALAEKAVLFEEFIAAEMRAGRLTKPVGSLPTRVLLHGHCHQKAFSVMPAVQEALSLIDGIGVEVVESSCCGMAGAFGYGAETHEVSLAMGELSLLPAVRAAPPSTVIAADGFSCRHQIADNTERSARHVVNLFRDAMRAASAS